MSSGISVRAALKKSSAWATPVAVGAGDGLYLKASADAAPERESRLDESLGRAFAADADWGESPALNQDLKVSLDYESLDLALALALGAAGTPDQQGGSSAYSNTYSLATSVDGLFATYVVSRDGEIWEYPSAKFTGFELKGEAGGAVEVSLKALRDRLALDSTTNTTSSFQNVTFPAALYRVMALQGTLRLNDASGAALGSGNVLYPKGFSFSFRRPLDGQHTVGGGDFIPEPTVSGQPEISLGFEFPQYEDSTLLTDFLANSNESKKFYKADLTFTGPEIGTGSGYFYTFKLVFPKLHLEKVEGHTESTGKIPYALSFKPLEADTAPTGMTVTKPFELQVTNTRSVSPLA